MLWLGSDNWLNWDGGLFSAEVGGDFAPFFGVPLEDGVGEGVCGEPVVGTLKQVANHGILCIGDDCGAAMPSLHPSDGGAAVGIDGECGIFFVESGECVDDGEEFADVVRAGLPRAFAEDFRASLHVNAAIFHRSRVFRACGIDGDAVEDDVGEIGIVHHRRAMRRDSLYDADMLLGVASEGFGGGCL